MAALSFRRCVVFLARLGCAEEDKPIRLTRKLKGLQTLHRYNRLVTLLRFNNSEPALTFLSPIAKTRRHGNDPR